MNEPHLTLDMRMRVFNLLLAKARLINTYLPQTPKEKAECKQRLSNIIKQLRITFRTMLKGIFPEISDAGFIKLCDWYAMRINPPPVMSLPALLIPKDKPDERPDERPDQNTLTPKL